MRSGSRATSHLISLRQLLFKFSVEQRTGWSSWQAAGPPPLAGWPAGDERIDFLGLQSDGLAGAADPGALQLNSQLQASRTSVLESGGGFKYSTYISPLGVNMTLAKFH